MQEGQRVGELQHSPSYACTAKISLYLENQSATALGGGSERLMLPSFSHKVNLHQLYLYIHLGKRDLIEIEIVL